MALPSPCFTQNVKKAVAPEKTHVKQDEVKQPNHFIAYCKVCREGFSSENLLFQHRKTHERCPYDGCSFNANSKVIAEHVQRVHIKSNTLVKIQDLTTPEQIEKWREERRKRFPTAANVLLRQQAKEARFERGEKLQDRQQRFGDSKQRNHIKNFDNRNNKGDNRHENKRNHQNNRRDRPWKQRNENRETPGDEKLKNEKEETTQQVRSSGQSSVVPTTSCIKEVKFLQPAINHRDEESSDEESKATPKFKGTSMMKDYHEVKTIVQEKAALSVLGMYGSDTESEVDSQVEAATVIEEPEVSSWEKVEEQKEESKEERAEDNPMSDDDLEAPEEVPIQHNSEGNLPDPSTSTEPEKLSRKRRHEAQQSQRFVRPKPRRGLDYSKLRTMSSVNPFLEKLLQEDIRHERNVLLQCVNYVVRSNFFESPPQPANVQLTTQEVSPGDEVQKSNTSDLMENIESL